MHIAIVRSTYRSRSRHCSQARFSPAASTACAASARRHPRTRHLAVQTIVGGIGISTDCPSPTAFALGLGPTNPERINLPQETLDIRRARFSRAFRYSCRHSHFRPLQPSSRSTFTADGTLPYHRREPEGTRRSEASVSDLSPVGSSARNHLTSELLRTEDPTGL